MEVGSDAPQNTLQLLVQDRFYAVDTAETFVIEDNKALNRFFAKVNRTRKPGIPVPVVDFSKEAILVACMGEVASDALPTMRLTAQNLDSLVVAVELGKRIDKGVSVSFPFCVYKIARTNQEIILEMP